METKDLIEHLHEWHENLISEMCADDILTCDDLCGYPGPCIVIQAADLLEAQQKRIAELEAALREQEERRWIPVTERLPELGERVLCTDGVAVFEQYRVELSCVYGIWDRFGMRSPMQEVTHWMPLPEPPKEDDYGNWI